VDEWFWRASWVCGEGRVDRAGHTTSLGTSLAGGCYLGVPHKRYLWRVHVIRRDPGVECLYGTKPWDRGVVLAWGTGCPIEWGIGSPLVKTSYLVTLRTGMS
jgi:hypothetical protein